MITLHHCAGARSFRPLWMLEEMGLDYRLELMPFPPRARVPRYKALNPLGTVPTFTDGEVLMTESAAICQYLAGRYGPTPLAVEPHEPGYGAWLNFLHMGEATLTFPQTIVLRYTQLEPPERRLPQAAADYADWFTARLKGALALMEGEFACAGRFTAADISLGYALQLATWLKLDDRFPPDAAAYYARLKARDGYRRARAAETPPAASASTTTSVREA